VLHVDGLIQPVQVTAQVTGVVTVVHFQLYTDEELTLFVLGGAGVELGIRLVAIILDTRAVLVFPVTGIAVVLFVGLAEVTVVFIHQTATVGAGVVALSIVAVMADYVTVVICEDVIPRVVLPALIATVVVIGAGLADVVLSIVDGDEILLRPFATVTATIPPHFAQAISTKGLFLTIHHNGKQFLISAATVHAVSQLVGVSIHTFHPPKFWGSSRHPTTTYPEGYVVSSFYLGKRTHQVVSEDTNIADPVSILLYVIADFPHSHRELWPALAEDTQVSFLVRDNH
jgi:hypothetical protein